jgi:Xaa-Pro aminopeptidase
LRRLTVCGLPAMLTCVVREAIQTHDDHRLNQAAVQLQRALQLQQSSSTSVEGRQMLTREGCQTRRDRLWNQIPDRFDWLLIGDPRHVQYFCNFRVHPLSFSADQRALLILTRDGSAILLADNFTRRTCNCDVHVSREVIVPWYTHRQSVTNRDHALITALHEVRDVWDGGNSGNNRGAKSGGTGRMIERGLLESEAISQLVVATVNDHCEPVFEDAAGRATTLGDVIRRLRRQKLSDEIALLRQCMTAGAAGQAVAFQAIRPGVTEFEVYLEVQRAAEEAAGAPCLVYGDFRATSAAQPKAGGLPTQHQLRSGELFILDYSVVIHGYRSDFTNTIAVDGPTDLQQQQFDACCAALTEAAQQLRPGVHGADIYEAASQVLQQRGLGPLAHHAGHGLGMEHPEPPIFVPESTDQLLVGDVVTLEPGCYREGVGGIRVEHNYLITESGAEQLSQHRLGLSD